MVSSVCLDPYSPSNVFNVFYLDTNGDLNLILCAEGSANQRQHFDLTQEAASYGAPKPVAGSPLAAYRGGGERVVYIGADGNIHQILQGPKWTDENVTQAASAPSPA